MGLAEDLRRLVEDAPPASFELPQLMRSRRRRAWPGLVTVGAFAAVALLTIGGFLVIGARDGSGTEVSASSSPTPPPPPSPTPTSRDQFSMRPPGVADTEQRLTAALASLPADLHVPADGSARFEFNDAVPASGQYTAHWVFGGNNYSINVTLDEKPNPAENGCAPENNGEGRCQRILTDGITYTLFFPKQGPTYYSLHVYFVAPDGTHVDVDVTNLDQRNVLKSSLMPVLVTAAHNPGLTMTP
jgi:hypothetical protein